MEIFYIPVNTLNNLNSHGLFNVIVVTLCVCFIVWFWNHRTVTKIIRKEKLNRNSKKKVKLTKKCQKT
jgi:Na+/phosphate symporter